MRLHGTKACTFTLVDLILIVFFIVYLHLPEFPAIGLSQNLGFLIERIFKSRSVIANQNLEYNGLLDEKSQMTLTGANLVHYLSANT